jgi:ABC-2 type transport system permease protein
MSASLILARHEWRRLSVQAWSWLLLAGVCGLLAWLFLSRLDIYLQLQQRTGNPPGLGVTTLVAAPVLGQLVIVLLVLVPIVGARSIASERRAHSLSLLLAAGIGDGAIVLGKWLALWAWLLLLTALAALLPFSLLQATPLDIGLLAANLLAVALLAGALAAIAVYASSVTTQPVLAAALALLINLLFWVVDAGARAAGLQHGLINWLALPTHLAPLTEGVVASVDIAWFVIVTALFLALAARQVGSLRSAD